MGKPMLKLLREDDIGPEFRSLKKGIPELLIAVAFWGQGAIKELGLSQGQKARVICNLNSSGCNPYVVETLIKTKGVTVRSHPRLHAKIYAGRDFAIVGSSNASTNGLGFEGDTTNSSIEANVASDDPLLVGEVLRLFDSLWKDDETGKISPAELQRAKSVYDKRPPKSPSATATTLLAACRENPDPFRSVFVAAYGEGLGPKGKRKLASLHEGAAPPDNSLHAADFKRAWGYQFGEVLPEGSWIIDLNCMGKKPKIIGCSKTTGLYMPIDGEPDLMITLRGVVTIPTIDSKFKILASEKQCLIKIASVLLKKDKFVPLSDALKMIDKK
jgi:hypothetical protein